MPGISQNRRAIGPPSFGSGYRAVAGSPAAQYFDPATVGALITLANGNREAGIPEVSAGGAFVRSLTGRSSGKHYAEFVLGWTNDSVGICNAAANYATGYLGDANSAGWWMSDGGLLLNDVSTDYGPAMAAGNVLGLAFDLDTKGMYVAVANTWRNGGNPVAGVNPFSIAALTGTLYLGGAPSHPTNRLTIRTGLADFTYSPPAGYSAWG